MEHPVGSSLLRCRAVRETPYKRVPHGQLISWNVFASICAMLAFPMKLLPSGSYSAVARCTCTWRCLVYRGKLPVPYLTVCTICGASFWRQYPRGQVLTYLKEAQVEHGGTHGT